MESSQLVSIKILGQRIGETVSVKATYTCLTWYVIVYLYLCGKSPRLTHAHLLSLVEERLQVYGNVVIYY